MNQIQYIKKDTSLREPAQFSFAGSHNDGSQF